MGCNELISKKCFIQNGFAWCLKHSTPSTEADGEEPRTERITSRDANGNFTTAVTTTAVRVCSHVEASGDSCDVFESGTSLLLFNAWSELHQNNR